METEPAVRSLPRVLLADVLIGAAVTLLAGVVRFVRLDIPKKLIPLDEAYYPVNALGLLRHGSDFGLATGGALPGTCSKIAIEPVFTVHPPVGKWLIGSGMRVFGCNSFGWRVAAALFGTATVLLVFLIARRLFRRRWIAGLAALLVAVDGLHFVQSRIAMLDIFLAFFIVLAIWLLVEDRARTSPTYRGWRPWRVGSAVAIGLATATKWSGAMMIPILLVLALVWEMDRRRAARRDIVADPTAPPPGAAETEPGAAEPEPDTMEAEALAMESEGGAIAPEPVATEIYGETNVPWEAPPASVYRPPSLWPQLASMVGAFVLIPIFVYVATYSPWFAAGENRYNPPRCSGKKIEFTGTVSPVNSKVWNMKIWPRNWKEWVCYQREIWDFHKNLKTLNEKGAPTHPYLSRAWSWPWMGRPTSHFFEQRGQDAPSCGQKSAVRSQAGRIDPVPLRAGPQGVDAQTAKTQTAKTPTVSPTAVPSPSPTVAPLDPTKPCKTSSEILGLPNPGMWLPAFFMALPLCVWWALRRRDQVAAMLLLLFAPLYLPWLITTRPLFLFYMTPAVPILALMVAHLVDRATTEFKSWQKVLTFALMFTAPFTPLYIQWIHSGRTVDLFYKVPALAVLLLVGGLLASLIAYSPKPGRLALAYAALTVAMFAYFYPVLAAYYIPHDGPLGWQKHMWLQRDCIGDRIRLTCWI